MQKPKNSDSKRNLNASKAIEYDIVKYQFSQFCKHNTQAIALILKALLKGEKVYQNPSASDSKSIPLRKNMTKIESKNPKPKAESKTLEISKTRLPKDFEI